MRSREISAEAEKASLFLAIGLKSIEMAFKFRQTLAFRLTLRYAIIFTLSSGVALFLFFLLITSFLREQTDQDLINQVRTIASVLTAQGFDSVERIAILEAQAAGERKIFIRLLSRNGSVFSSSNMSYWEDIGVAGAAVTQLLEGSRYVFDTVDISNPEKRVRILYSMIGRNLVVQLGRSMENYSLFVRAFQRISLVTLSLLLAASGLIGWFMARQALSGMEVVTRTARDISSGALDKRVPVTRKGDEIDQLATTFNRMLDRIEGLVTGIKEMSDNIAHDLKSPVTRIRGIAEVTITTDPSVQAYENMAASIIEECDRLLDMINTMLVISRTEAGVDKLKLEKVNISRIVQDACVLFKSSAEDKELAMNCAVAEEIFLSGDRRMIQRLVANLIDNAIRYTPARGVIDISLRSTGQPAVEITISDTGAGISAEDLPHIFERFYRCDPSRTDTGTGLGLSLALAIARAHGGDIAVSSRPGKGSRFTITLPLNPPT